MKTNPKAFDIIMATFAVLLVLSNAMAMKVVDFGLLTLDAAALLFPVTYIFGDILTEVYGYQRSRKVIWTAFLLQGLVVLYAGLVVWLPPAEGWPLQEQFATVWGLMPRIAVASLVAFFAGEWVNSVVLSRLKVRTKGRHLWARTISSTIAGQAVDTTLFILIAFLGVFPARVVVAVIASNYLWKVSYEAVATPITYAVVNRLKRYEGAEVFDTRVTYNPAPLPVDETRHDVVPVN